MVGETLLQYDTARNYGEELDAILSRPLMPEIIDTYAENALNDLIGLVQEAVQDYKYQPTIDFDNKLEQENAAFAYHKLGNIEIVLDHLADKTEELNQIDRFIENSFKADGVIVPPDAPEHRTITAGNDKFEKKKLVPRLKTTLFILANEFEVDINDPEQLSLSSGLIEPSMMRENSYYIVEAHRLGKTILVCDEEGNVSYVLDNHALQELDISSSDFENLTKQDINELLAEEPRLGSRLIYSKNFVPNMIQALYADRAQDRNLANTNTSSSMLYPKAPEGVLSVNGMSKRFGVDRRTVDSVLLELSEDLGKTTRFRFGSFITAGFTVDQQAQVEEVLKIRGFFDIIEAPEDVMSTAQIARSMGLSHNVVKKSIEGLGENLGEVSRYRFRQRMTEGYTPAQQDAIEQDLRSKGLLIQKAPEDVLSLKGIADLFGVSQGALERALEELAESLGEVQIFKFRSQPTRGYTPNQQAVFKQYLIDRSMIDNTPPVGTLTLSSLAERLGITRQALKKVIESVREEYGEEFGNVEKYKFISKITFGYTPDQQEMIRSRVENKQ